MTVKSLFMEPAPIVPLNVPVSGGDSANIKVCYCVVCVGLSQLFRWIRVLNWNLVCSLFRM